MPRSETSGLPSSIDEFRIISKFRYNHSHFALLLPSISPFATNRAALVIVQPCGRSERLVQAMDPPENARNRQSIQICVPHSSNCVLFKYLPLRHPELQTHQDHTGYSDYRRWGSPRRYQLCGDKPLPCLCLRQSATPCIRSHERRVVIRYIQCPGKDFALQEATYMLARLVQRFSSIELVPEALPKGAAPPASWKQGKGRQTVEKCWPATAFTIFIRVSTGSEYRSRVSLKLMLTF